MRTRSAPWASAHMCTDEHTSHCQACADKLDAELNKYGVPPKFPDAEAAAEAELAAAEAAGEVTAEEVGGRGKGGVGEEQGGARTKGEMQIKQGRDVGT